MTDVNRHQIRAASLRLSRARPRDFRKQRDVLSQPNEICPRFSPFFCYTFADMTVFLLPLWNSVVFRDAGFDKFWRFVDIACDLGRSFAAHAQDRLFVSFRSKLRLYRRGRERQLACSYINLVHINIGFGRDLGYPWWSVVVVLVVTATLVRHQASPHFNFLRELNKVWIT